MIFDLVNIWPRNQADLPADTGDVSLPALNIYFSARMGKYH